MSGFVEKGIIRVHNHVGPDIWLMQIELPRIAKEAKPGQFVHVKVNDPRWILRRPISIHDVEGDEITMVYEVKGDGTRWLSRRKRHRSHVPSESGGHPGLPGTPGHLL